MELNTRGVTPQGLFQNSFVDQYDRFLLTRAERYNPTHREQVELFTWNQLVDGSSTGLGYKWIVDFRSKLNTRMQQLQTKLNQAFQAMVDRAFAENSASRTGSIPILRNWWQQWQVSTFPTDDGTAQRFYPSTFSNVLGNSTGNIKALADREITFDVTNGGAALPDSVHPIGTPLYSPEIYGDALYTYTATNPDGSTKQSENLFLKALYDSFNAFDLQELYGYSSRLSNQGLFREVFVGSQASDGFGSALAASAVLSFESRGQNSSGQLVGEMTFRLNKATAYYHS